MILILLVIGLLPQDYTGEDVNVNNFKSYSECPIVTLQTLEGSKIWPCIYINKYSLYGVVFPNIDYEKYKTIRSDINKPVNLKLDDEEKLYKMNT